MPPASGRVFEFGRFRLDTTQGVLFRDGERVALIPKAVDLLAVLLGAAGRVVTKEQLLETVWPDAFVQEGNLSKLVFLLRRELDAAPGSGAIETVSKRGYAFKGSVREVTSPSADAPSASIAVLPFTTSGDTPAHLGESVAEEVLVALSRGPDVAVVARTSSFRFGAAASDVSEIGRRLRVTAVVQGNVRAEGERVRVTAELVDAVTSFQRWSRVFEGDRAGLSTLPAAIAAAIVEAVAPSATPASTSPRTEHHAVAEAYDLYLQGRYFWNRRPGDASWRALECFEKAARLDADFAEAWAGIADVYSTLGSWEAGVLPHDEAQQKARAFAERALALNPHLAEAITTLAYTTLHYGWDPAAAEAGFAAALGENPRYAVAHHWQSHAFVAQGRVVESLAASRRALAHDPMNILLTAHLSWHHHMAREPERALEQAERVTRLEPQFHWGHYFVSWASEALGEVSRAVDAARMALRCMEGNPVMQALVGRALAVAGDRTGAAAILTAIARDDGDARYAYEMALIHLGLNDADRALGLLQRARERRSGWMVYAHVDPRMDPIRADPRFAELVPISETSR